MEPESDDLSIDKFKEFGVSFGDHIGPETVEREREREGASQDWRRRGAQHLRGLFTSTCVHRAQIIIFSRARSNENSFAFVIRSKKLWAYVHACTIGIPSLSLALSLCIQRDTRKFRYRRDIIKFLNSNVWQNVFDQND